jgi:hypothetical protein
VAKGKGGGSGQKYNMAVNVKRGDIVTAAKSLAGPTDYPQGYPAHESLHINRNATIKAKRGD